MSKSRSPLLLVKDHRKFYASLLCLIGTLIIGDVDYLTGYQISLLVFYILPVGIATIYVGPVFAVSLAILSVAISICTDFWSGMPYAQLPLLASNASIVLSTFFIVIGLLQALNRILRRLETSVEQKTKALLTEMRERGRLEREIIDLSEREQRRFGQELHDVVCQELASMSIASHLLTRKMLAAAHEDQEHARKIAEMADHALETTRSVARGFFTAGFDSAGLAEALRETARHTEATSRIACDVHWQENLTMADEDTVINLFRIAQEAIQNAVKHSGASRIHVNLERQDKMFYLTIEDDGRGLADSNGKDKGLGLRIMAYRAGLIGAELKIERPDRGGTRIVCRIPLEILERPALEMARR